MKTKVIVVVDERSGLAEKIEELLHRQGYHACSVPSPRAALRRAAGCNHQVAIVDYDVAGAEALAVSLRSRGVSVVGIASTEATRARAAGASAWLPKPCSAKDIMGAVVQALTPPKVPR